MNERVKTMAEFRKRDHNDVLKEEDWKA